MVLFFQLLGAPFTWLFYRVFTRYEVVGVRNLADVERPLIVVANHESFMDPIIIGLALVRKLRILPFYYMTKKELFYIPLLNILMWLYGAFVVVRGKGLNKALETPLRLLKKRKTVIMFPEGRIISERGTLGPGKRGAAALAIMTGSAILPVSVHSPRNLTPWKLFFTRRGSKHIRVNIGVPFYLDNMEYPDVSDFVTAKATDRIMSEIKKLYSGYKY